MTTLKEAMSLLGAIVPKSKKNIAGELLGKYKGTLPKDKTSSSFVKGLRANLYGKTK